VWLELFDAGAPPANIEAHTLVRLEICTVHVGGGRPRPPSQVIASLPLVLQL